VDPATCQGSSLVRAEVIDRVESVFHVKDGDHAISTRERFAFAQGNVGYLANDNFLRHDAI
jgi:hypothetical protein